MPNLFDFSVVLRQLTEILRYLPVTLELTVISLVLGLILGLLLALVQIKRVPVLYQLTRVYISLIRGTPILVQLYITYFGIPILLRYINYYWGTDYNINAVPDILFAIVALVFNTAAYNAVTIRAAIEAVDRGQVEAANSLGMTYGQILRRIIIPEAVELAVPSIGNTGINLMKSTSLAFSCAVVEITAQAKIVASRDFRYFEAYVALGIIYWFLTVLLEQVVRFASESVRVPEVVSGREVRREEFEEDAI